MASLKDAESAGAEATLDRDANALMVTLSKNKDLPKSLRNLSFASVKAMLLHSKKPNSVDPAERKRIYNAV